MKVKNRFRKRFCKQSRIRGINSFFIGGINEKDHGQCLASQAGMLFVKCLKLGVSVQV